GRGAEALETGAGVSEPIEDAHHEAHARRGAHGLPKRLRGALRPPSEASPRTGCAGGAGARVVLTQTPPYRRSIGTYVACEGSVYYARGRINRLFGCCSMLCAPQ